MHGENNNIRNWNKQGINKLTVLKIFNAESFLKVNQHSIAKETKDCSLKLQMQLINAIDFFDLNWFSNLWEKWIASLVLLSCIML